MRRVAAVLVTDATGSAPPPGVDPRAFALALIEDTYEVVAGLELCDPVVLAWCERQDRADALAADVARVTWPETPVLGISATTGPTGDPPRPGAPQAAGEPPLTGALRALAGRGAEQAVVVSADAPDLPPLLVGKLFRALGSAEVAACPAADGGLVALACRLPLPGWAGTPDLDDPETLATLTATRPQRRALATVSGWHRVRTPDQIAHLDPDLEGWDSTRLLLG